MADRENLEGNQADDDLDDDDLDDDDLDDEATAWIPSSMEGSVLSSTDGHSDQVRGALVLPDGAVLSWSDDSTLKVWDIEEWQCRQTLKGHAGGVFGALLLPDGDVLSWGVDHTLKVWDMVEGVCRRTIQGPRVVVGGGLLLPNGDFVSWPLWGIAEELRYGEEELYGIKVWNVATGECRWTLAGHTGRVCGALVLPDGAVLSWSADGTLRIWDAVSGTCRMTLDGHDGKHVFGALVLPGGRRALSWATHGYDSCIWDLSTGACLKNATSETQEFRDMKAAQSVVLPDDQSLLLPDGFLVRWYDLQLLDSDQCDMGIWHNIRPYGGDGYRLGPLLLSDWRVVEATGDLLLWLDCHEEQVHGALLLPDGGLLSWSGDGTLRVWDL